jgi:hydrogenase-4 component B
MTAFLVMVSAYLVGALGSLAIGASAINRRLTAVAAVLGAAAGLGLAADVLASGTPFVLHLPGLLAPGGGMALRLDALGAFFLVVIGVGAIPAAVYGVGYTAAYEGRYSLRWLGAMLNLFLLTMSLVVLADNVLTFLLVWEAMSLASYFLVMTEHDGPDTVAAGGWYLAMTHVGLALVLTAFVMLMPVGPGSTFAELRATAASLSPAGRGLVFTLAVLGFGGKAGLVPLHVWLPRAHPAAPSHVSALMSGVMTKVAVYGFARIVLDLAGEPAWWWSVLVLSIAAITCVMGVLYALMQHDLKRLLAYHTVENIGIIFIALGLALAFKAYGMAWAAALALTAGLLHVLNHSLFKSLLFFGAGSVLTATGERDMEHLGGLIHRMPQTAFAFLIGCAAISALPPLNGFVSEWLIFQAILLSPQLPSWGLKFLVPAVGALLALSATLAAACFVKAFGLTFLGRARSTAASAAVETDRLSLTAMLSLAALCLIAGILPGLFIDALATAVQGLAGGRMPVQTGVEWLSIVPIAQSRSSYNGLLVFLFMMISGALAASAIHRLASDRLRRAPAWDCGYPDASPATQYSASSFAQPIRRVFGSMVFRAREQVEMPPPGDLRPARLAVVLHDPVWEMLYLPVATGVSRAAERLNHLQFLTIRQFLSIVFAALLVLLLVLALWP